MIAVCKPLLGYRLSCAWFEEWAMPTSRLYQSSAIWDLWRQVDLVYCVSSHMAMVDLAAGHALGMYFARRAEKSRTERFE